MQLHWRGKTDLLRFLFVPTHRSLDENDAFSDGILSMGYCSQDDTWDPMMEMAEPGIDLMTETLWLSSNGRLN